MMYGADWTFDRFMEDVNRCGAEVDEAQAGEDYRAYFMSWYKRAAEDFRKKWLEDHDGALWDKYDGWAGDRFADTLPDWFSDFYKDAYGQRPHLPRWYYVQAVGLPMSEDVARTFCASPVEEAVEMAVRCRQAWK